MEAAKHRRSTPDLTGTFLLFSNMPTKSIITITWPSFVFSSSRDLISSHFGRSCSPKKDRSMKKSNRNTVGYAPQAMPQEPTLSRNKPNRLDPQHVAFSSHVSPAISRLLMKSS
eukprot:TRINITY_DN5414_c0_g1_i3.p1 TRINITY_DN5414_c0_g1~~TRINITY_DN5414_c0_g1_i3.p1  ORF type:complete len:114 (+),score=6.08 TRINITY_DN5414_c0_g1_i3:276-617(+)